MNKANVEKDVKGGAKMICIYIYKYMNWCNEFGLNINKHMKSNCDKR